MKQIRLLLMSLGILLSSLAQGQEHRTIGAQCKFYVPSDNPGSATPDGDTGCAVCQKERQEEYERLAAISRKEQEVREERIARENEAWKEKHRAEKQAFEDRNTAALGKLENLSRDSEAYDRLRREEKTRKEAVRKRYDEQVERGNRDYNDYLANLQKMASTTPEASTEAFWTETVSPANYIPFSDGGQLFGFQDRNGKVKITPKYFRASHFSGGIAFVGQRTEEGNNFQLINSREETVVTFNEAFLNRISDRAGKKIIQWSFPDTISEGLVILKLEDADYKNKNSTGAVDKNGDLAIPPAFYQIKGFKNGVSVASKFIDHEQYTFENFPRNYYGDFNYLEVGLIDKKGNWVEPPKKKLEYRSYSSSIGYLTVSDKDERLTEAEKRYQEEQWELTKKKRYDESMRQLEQEVQNRVSRAQAQGYLIENMNPENDD